MKIISHSADADGRLSAWLVANKFKMIGQEESLLSEDDFIMTDYGKHDDIFSKIEKDEKVVICDFSFENGPEDMKKLQEITNDITWIDHHKSAIEKYGDYGKDIKGLRVDGTAACMLTYIYYYILKLDEVSNLTQRQCELFYNKAPKLVQLVHDNDVWRYQYGEETEFFKLGLDAENIVSPLDNRWRLMYNSKQSIHRIINTGIHIKKYRDSLGDFACNSAGFEYEIDGLKGFCLNNVFGGSPWFGDRIKQYDFVCCFNYIGDSKEWEYSFYSEKEDVDCSKIAQKVDSKGGGHKGAAGCTTKKFIF